MRWKIGKFTGQVNQSSRELLQEFIMSSIENGYKNIVILFDSKGGFFVESLTFNDFMSEVTSEHDCQLVAVNIGAVCSSATTMFLSFHKDNRYYLENTIFHFHEVFPAGIGPLSTGIILNAKQIAQKTMLNNAQAQIISEETSLSQADVLGIVAIHPDYTVRGETISQLGFAKKIDSAIPLEPYIIINEL